MYPTRRHILATAGAALTAAVVKAEPSVVSLKVENVAEPFGYCLNTSTIRGQNLPLTEERSTSPPRWVSVPSSRGSGRLKGT